MTSPTEKDIFAPAKVNLFLHTIEKNNDGYHELESLIAFADFGDNITIRTADSFSFKTISDHNICDDNDNLVVKAAKLLAEELNAPLNLSITLDKKTPIGAGLGGGSADAAATIDGLLNFWETDLTKSKIDPILLELGADVPACYNKQAAYIKGIGDIIEPINSFPKCPAILIYPNEFCSTAKVFQSFDGSFSPSIEAPLSFKNKNDLYKFLKEQKNDLTNTAIQNVPEIKNVLNIITEQNGCVIARLSGSGSACFGLFNTNEESQQAALNIQKEKPHWWVRPVIIS